MNTPREAIERRIVLLKDLARLHELEARDVSGNGHEQNRLIRIAAHIQARARELTAAYFTLLGRERNSER